MSDDTVVLELLSNESVSKSAHNFRSRCLSFPFLNETVGQFLLFCFIFVIFHTTDTKV